MPSPCPKIEVQYIDVQKQKGQSDCGLFAIAFATSLAHLQDPASKTYDQAKMRTHLIHCFETQSMTPFPSHGSRRPSDPNIEAYSIYCICRMINDGTPMIQCSSCTEWYHMACCAVPSRFMTIKTTMEMPVLCKVTELFIHCHTCMYMQLILICSNCIRSSFPILLSNTIQACRIIFIRYCRRCINTARNLGNHCNNLTSHLVKHTPKINLINAQITCIYMHAACIV